MFLIGLIAIAGGIYIIALIILAIATATVLQNPLMNDYVKKSSRGKGAGIEKLGYVAGVLVAILIP